MKTRPKRNIHPRRQPRRARQGLEAAMRPRPRFVDRRYQGAGKLAHKVAIIIGGDSGIGRAVAVAFAQEGADVVIVYHRRHHADANETRAAVELRGRRCILMPGDVGEESFCKQVVKKTVDIFSRVDIVVNNAAIQTFLDDFTKMSTVHR